MPLLLSLLAASALNTVQQVPPATWAKIAIGLGVLVVAVFVLRAIIRLNKFVLGFALLVCLSLLFFSWVYLRNEPRLLTPAVEKIAPYFPSAKPKPDMKR